MNDQPQHGPKINVGLCFYRELDVRDDALLSGVEQGIDLYINSQDPKKTDSALNYEKALGILTLSYIKLGHAIIREDWRRISQQRKLFLNFGVLDPRLMPNEKVMDELVRELVGPQEHGKFDKYYLNEWLEKIGRGAISLTSDVAQSKSKTQTQEQRDKVMKKIKEVQKTLDEIFTKENDTYQKLITGINEYNMDAPATDKIQLVRTARQYGAELEAILKEQAVKDSELHLLNTRLGGSDDAPGSAVDEHHAGQMRRIKEEFDILVVVAKSCAVRGGYVKNTPVLIDKCLPMDTRIIINTKTFVEEKLIELEEIDHTIFQDKTGKRTPPKVLIIPGVGTGMAWTDRIVMPVFTPATIQPEISLIRTLAAYRWYRATASYRWRDMPGEFGSCYQYIYPDKNSLTLQKTFVDDYTNWMTKEAQGYQVLHADVRKLFWKHIPFATDLKRKLYTRAAVYRTLFASEMGSGMR